MIVTDKQGLEWATYAVALEEVPGLNASTLRGWVRRGKVRCWHPFAPASRGVMVCMTDVWPLVRDAVGAGWRRGRRPSRPVSTPRGTLSLTTRT